MERNVTKIKQHHLYCNHMQAGIIFSKRELCSSYQRVPEQFFLSRMIRAQKKKKRKEKAKLSGSEVFSMLSARIFLEHLLR